MRVLPEKFNQHSDEQGERFKLGSSAIEKCFKGKSEVLLITAGRFKVKWMIRQQTLILFGIDSTSYTSISFFFVQIAENTELKIVLKTYFSQKYT